MVGKYYEDFEVGDRFVTVRRTISETDIVNFVNLTGLLEPIFTDKEHWEKESIFKKRFAPAPLTLSCSLGLVAQLGLTHGTAMALLGMDEVRAVKPVFCDDTIYVENELTEKKPTKRPDRGILIWKREVKNQNNELALSYFHTMMVLRK
ncbi:MAG: MaoC family dehydratase N-terminal domain-containing protein [Candidatus Tectomicrobia bacterium]|uniref:MaoC family dehydratase N-terminal domain-containing protein n=1 Tax=Tectimicrobiota bacterium TaxID=2528274 RepID=A0A933GLT1_UNCTE|nr:MaoC family dehydratase N-terminal domain-containing protein [Candidatus Tectomicrobia bacterium]